MPRPFVRGARAVAAPLAAAALTFGLPGGLRAQEEIFSLDVGLVIWTWVLFLLTLGVLAWKVFPWIAGGLEERHAKIQRSIDEARETREEARAVLEEHRAQLAEARREAQKILDDNRRAGERLRERIQEQAREEREELLARARRDMQRDREQLIEELRTEAVDISIAAAERLIRSELDTDQNRRLVREYVSRLG